MSTNVEGQSAAAKREESHSSVTLTSGLPHTSCDPRWRRTSHPSAISAERISRYFLGIASERYVTKRTSPGLPLPRERRTALTPVMAGISVQVECCVDRCAEVAFLSWEQDADLTSERACRNGDDVVAADDAVRV